jgi:hypothetical protein
MKYKIVIVVFLLALNAAATAASTSVIRYSELILSEKPIAYWQMQANKQGQFPNHPALPQPLTATSTGKTSTANGPTAPIHPGFSTDMNPALGIPNSTGYLVVDDPGDNSPLDFTSGDNITIEAWISPAKLSGFQYIVGKGRTGRSGFPVENHNYAIRLTATGNLTFLFRSRTKTGEEQYHRWTSTESIMSGDGWHHVAVTYTFGKTKNIQGFIDGQRAYGKWDLGGDTGAPPVVDNDQLWIGSALSGNPNSTFQGAIDEVAIYRHRLTADQIATRYSYQEQAPKFNVQQIPKDEVLVQIFEGVNDKSFLSRSPQLTGQYTTAAFAFFQIPNKYNAQGIKIDRSSPFMIRAYGNVVIPTGTHRILVRARNGARLFIDGELKATVPFFNISSKASGAIFEVQRELAPSIRGLQRGDSEVVFNIEGDGQQHQLRFEMIVGGGKRRPETGETAVCIATETGEFSLFGKHINVTLTNENWLEFKRKSHAAINIIDRNNRLAVTTEERNYWQRRHVVARDIISRLPKLIPPEPVFPETIQNPIDQFINARLGSAKQTPRPLIGDYSFIRRLALDTIGTIHAADSINAIMASDQPIDRNKLVQQFLDDDRWADHWTAYWQDVLAENPNLVNPTLNNTGPFRWWIHESFIDNKPMDRFATDLIMMQGSAYYGGPAGFSMATQNDVPLAAKAHILSQAFLGIQLQCARCHDAPFHDLTQQDLFSVAAMLKRGNETVPKSSTVPISTTGGPVPNISITLKPGAAITPVWPFAELGEIGLPSNLIRSGTDTRAQLAENVTGPGNMRFAQVIVNRLWKRTMGYGLVEPVEDWEHADISHPQLLEFLARELIANSYDLKHIANLIFTSHTYQRKAIDLPANGTFLFPGPATRRMTAEQIIDSIFVASGRPFDAGPMNIDIDGARDYTVSLNLGIPQRAWQFASLGNERDRPSLSLPFAQPFTSAMTVFGWNGARQNPINQREQDVNVLQAAILNNGLLLRDNVRLGLTSAFTQLALQAEDPTTLVKQTYLRILGRTPDKVELNMFVELIRDGFSDRRISVSPAELALAANQKYQLPRDLVSWSNHNSMKANEIKLVLRKAVYRGESPTPQLNTAWREQMEDMVWVLFNSPEFIYIR